MSSPLSSLANQKKNQIKTQKHHTLETPKTSSWLQQQRCLAGFPWPAECPTTSGQRATALSCAEPKQLFQMGGSGARCNSVLPSPSHEPEQTCACLGLHTVAPLSQGQHPVTPARMSSHQSAPSGVSYTAVRLTMAFFQGQAARLLLPPSPVKTENQAQDPPRCCGCPLSSKTPRAAAGAFLLLYIPSPPHALSHEIAVTPEEI